MWETGPGWLGHVVTAAVQRFLVGLAVVKRPDLLALAMALSLILWAVVAWSMWAAAVAFGIGVSFGGAIVLMGLVALGVAVPTPARSWWVSCGIPVWRHGSLRSR